MKTRVLMLMLTVLCLLGMLASCTIPGFGPQQPPTPGGTGETENLIYDATSELNIIIGEGVDGELGSSLYEAITNARGNAVGWRDTSAEEIEHEIVVGNNTGRKVTEDALMRLGREEDNKNSDDDFSYVIYSDGSSVAIVFNEDYDNATQKLAIENFIDEFANETLIKAPGVIAKRTFNIIEEYYTPLDEAHRAEILAAAEKSVGAETVAALRSMMALYDIRLIEWIANLYDPCICVCVGLGETECQGTKYCKAEGGGFYFSNSARDNVGYLPDLESTRQALSMLTMSGMTWAYGDTYTSGALPKEMLEAIGRYTQIIQSPDGYFRHPQWSHLADYDMRLNRDLSWATTLLNAAQMSPFYTTPTGMQGIGAPSASAGNLTTNVHKSSVAAVSKVMATAASYPAILESIETFAADLEAKSKSIRTSSYGTGSRYSTYLAQINARDRVLGTPDNPQPLMTMLYEWYEYHKNPERGTWVGDEEYGGNPEQVGAYAETNGVMKIIGCYSNIKRPYSYGIEAMRACIDVLTTEESPTGTVDIYNAFIALNGVYSIVIKYNSAEEAAEARALMAEFRQNATEAIIASRDKLAGFKRDDGSFSYSPKGGSGYSMGMPTQVKGTSEGDVNGALIASADCWGYICSCLGITKIPLFGMAEMYRFRNIIADSGPAIKQGVSFDYTVADFEDDEVGEETGANLSLGKQSPEASFLVREDGTTKNKYLEFITGKSSSGDSVVVKCESQAASATSFTFEGDFCLVETSEKYAYQIWLGSISYAIQLRKDGDNVRLIEASSDSTAYSLDRDLGVSPKFGEWFRLKIVYFTGDHDTVRIKVYYDNLSDGEDEVKLISVSDNYFDKYGDKFNGNGAPKNTFSQTTIYSYAPNIGTLLLDNLASYKSKDEYKPEIDPENQPIYNVDPPDSPEKVYDFEDGELPSDLTVKSGEPSIITVGEGREISITGKAELSLPINVRTQGTKCATASFDLTANSVSKGDFMTLTMSEAMGNLFSLAFSVDEDNEGKYIVCYEKNESMGSKLATVRIPVGEKINVTVDYHHNEDIALIYVGGEFVAASATVYSGAKRRTVTTLSLVTQVDNLDISIDNVIFERNTNSYAEATKPAKDSVTHKFEDGVPAEGVTLSGGATVSNYSAGGDFGFGVEMPVAAKSSSLTVPVNKRSSISSVVRLKMNLFFKTAAVNGETHTIAITDIEGNTIFALAIKINADLVEIYETTANGTAKTRLASASKNSVISLQIDIFQGEKIANVYLGGTCVATTSVFYDPANVDMIANNLVVATSKTKSQLYVDNVMAESLYEAYIKATVTTEENEDTKNPLDFEMSSTGSLPNGIIKSATNVRVENMYNGITGEYSKVGVLDTIRGRNEMLGTSLEKSNTMSCVTVEFDFMISNPEYEHITQLFLTDNNTNPGKAETVAYGMAFQKSGDGFKISDYSGGAIKSTLVSGLSFDTWYRLKLEYYITVDGKAKICVYINDQLEYVTQNYYNVATSSAKVDVKNAFFYTYLDSKASIYVDNMSISTSDATCSEEVGDK